jgi:hypothetical protein
MTSTEIGTGSRRVVSHAIGASQRIPIACETLLHVNCCRILSATCHLLRDIAHRTIHSRKCFLWKPFGSTGTRHDWIYTPVLPRVLTPTRSVPLSRARTARLRDIQVSPIAGREGPIRHTILISYIKQQLEISSTTSAAG